MCVNVRLIFHLFPWFNMICLGIPPPDKFNIRITSGIQWKFMRSTRTLKIFQNKKEGKNEKLFHKRFSKFLTEEQKWSNEAYIINPKMSINSLICSCRDLFWFSPSPGAERNEKNKGRLSFYSKEFLISRRYILLHFMYYLFFTCKG